MGTDVTDSAQLLFLEPAARDGLTNALQRWLLATSSLTLVLLAGEGASARENASLKELGTTLDEIEQVALASVRRTDRVVRCGFSCCALALLDTGVDGAQCVVNRLRARLEHSTTRRPPLLMGLATAPEHATEAEALVAQACRFSISLVLPGAQENVIGNVAARMEWPDVPFTPQRRGVSRRSGGTIRRLNPALSQSAELTYTLELRRSAKGRAISEQPSTVVQARALALGVPYLAPPHSIPTSVRNLLPQEVMEQLQCLPVGRERNVLTVALADPTNREVLFRLEQMTGMSIFPVMTDPDVLKALARPAHSRQTSPLPSTSTSRTGR